MIRFFLTVTAVLIFGSGFAWAASLEDGVAAHQRGEYATAIAHFKSMADEGNPAAQFNLGQMYRLGQGVPRNAGEAARWYHLAAAQGDGQSQYNLGVMYYNAQGVPRNFVFSHMWLTLSAATGVENAVRNRAMLSKQMTPEQIAQALQLARDCKQREFRKCD
jgi:TPR repeat protein